MATWEEYKEHVKSQSPRDKVNMEGIEDLSMILSAIIARREELGMSQRDLAKACGINQSSLARLETCRVTPQVDTLLRVMKPLGLTLSVIPSETASSTHTV